MFKKEVREVLESAYKEAKNRSHEYITTEHVFYVSLDYPYLKRLLEEFSLETDLFKSSLDRHLKDNIPTILDSDPVQTKSFTDMLENAAFNTHSSSKKEVDMGSIIVSIFTNENSYSSYLMRQMGISKLRLLQTISHDMNDYEYKKNNPDQEVENPYQNNALSRFTVDLVKEAKEGNIDPFIGREIELEKTLAVLKRRIKNNPIHIGEPGVGKTAIVEGLALLIAQNKIPSFLKDKKIHSLDMGDIVAGTKYRGDLEERIKALLKEIEEDKDIILFIDEIHSIVKTGSAAGGSLDIAALLKPFLARGKVRIIGTSTNDEFRKFIEKDKALARRFQAINVKEPSFSDTIKILTGIKNKYERFHNVFYSDDIIENIVKLSNTYINDRFQPDKSIDVMDEVGSRVSLNNAFIEKIKDKIEDHQMDIDLFKNEYKEILKLDFRLFLDVLENRDEELLKKFNKGNLKIKSNIDISDLEDTISKIANIPRKTVVDDETERLRNLELSLKNQIFGQDEAITDTVRIIKRSRMGFNKKDKPMASFLFVGPTGVGKTELSKQLASFLNMSFIRFDMSEYQEEHTVAKLIGSPPGYVGYSDGGLLVNEIRKNHSCVLLLDEIEKAHFKIYNILLQIMDYATLTDSSGIKADFKNVILIMTSNAGARDINKKMVGFSETDEIYGDSAIEDALKRVFNPEFRNRLDKSILFSHLKKDIINNITKKEIDEFVLYLKEDKNIELEYGNEIINHLSQLGYSREFGARNISRIVETHLIDKLIDKMLFEKDTFNKVTVFLDDNAIKLDFNKL